MKRKKVLALAGAAVVVFLTGFGVFYVNQKDEVIPDFVLTYAENQASDYPTTLGGAYFARLVNERTGGKVEIRIYDNSVLGDEVSVMKQIQYGGIDFARMSISTLADIVPSLYFGNAISLPGFRSYVEGAGWRNRKTADGNHG